MALITISRCAIGHTLTNMSIEILHTEEVRGDKRVPPDVR